jgi:hypothetical protein
MGHLRLPILADVITPFMFAVGARLVFANILIAFIESLIIPCFSKLRYRKLFGWMVLANYFSAIVGGLLLTILAGVAAAGFQPMVFHLRGYLATMFVIAMVLSFLLELPFVVAAGGKAGRTRRSILACAAAQLGSYAVLLPIYYMVTQVRMAGEVNPVRSLDFVSRKSARVLFLSPDGCSVFQVRLDGSGPEKLLDVYGQAPGTRPNDLTIWKASDAERWDLWLTDSWGFLIANGTGGDKLLRPGIATAYPERNEDHLNEVVDWRSPDQRDWQVEAASDAYAPGLGLKAHNTVTGATIHVAVDTPFVSWLSRCPTLLPGDQVVFEMSGQIVVLDLKTRKLGFVAFGHSPVVVLAN